VYVDRTDEAHAGDDERSAGTQQVHCTVYGQQHSMTGLTTPTHSEHYVTDRRDKSGVIHVVVNLRRLLVCSCCCSDKLERQSETASPPGARNAARPQRVT